MARIVALRLPDDIYRELERKARRLGYSLVSDYLRDIVFRELGYKEESIRVTLTDVERIVEEKLSRLGSGLNVDKLVARLERRLQDLVNPWTAKVDQLSARLAEVIERIEQLEVRIKSVEDETRSLREALQNLQQTRMVTERREQTVARQLRRRSAIERLREQGVVFEHEVQWLRDRDAFFERLRREGAIILDVGGERVAVDPEFWENFRDKVEKLPTANDDEVKLLLTEQQYALFKKLKEAGLIYFDATRRTWKFVGEVGGR
ncbi:hypothetical protein [Hyperthermus butylicus]|uniref:Conserved crenarchaeal protein n=1 Tax=Hyperthermus butylicus (strain DSM 5456 / JCM 9403 / PLM1-5) TaxID=415426 RepID=A2BLV9_HYPBU|nr:hypothetical protein [Hyperthermus butylicus]ABM80970.1 conserved crenarchaeal protein [Hyperthermus butylicus DSM 5456]